MSLMCPGWNTSVIPRAAGGREDVRRSTAADTASVIHGFYYNAICRENGWQFRQTMDEFHVC